MKTLDVEQGSDEWFAARCGKFTASRVKDIMAKTKSGPAASRKNMITQLSLERLTGQMDEGYSNTAMQRGTDMEPEARAAYSFETGKAVQEVGMVIHPDWDFVTCSPDGIVGDDGLVEIKCPSAMAKHLSYLEAGKHALEYKWQLQHQLFVTGREWVDIASYDPRYPEGLQLAVTRVFPVPEMQEELKAEITKANEEINNTVAALKAMQTQKAA